MEHPYSTRRRVYLYLAAFLFAALFSFAARGQGHPADRAYLRTAAQINTISPNERGQRRFYVCSDCLDASSCATGGGSTENLCKWDGSAWEVVGSAIDTDTLTDSDSTFSVIDAAGEGLANARLEFKPNGSTLATKVWGIKYDPEGFPDPDDSEVHCYETFSDGATDDCAWTAGNVGGGDSFTALDGRDIGVFLVDDDGSGANELSVQWTTVPASGDWYAEMRVVSIINGPPVDASDFCGMVILREGTTGSPTELRLFGYVGDATEATGWDLYAYQKDDYSDAVASAVNGCDNPGGCWHKFEELPPLFMKWTDSTDTVTSGVNLHGLAGAGVESSAFTASGSVNPTHVGFGCMAQASTADATLVLSRFAIVTGTRATNRAIGN